MAFCITSTKFCPVRRSGHPSLCDASLDLCCSTFCVPILDYHSPAARAVIDEVHWYHLDVKHSRVESLMRQVQLISYVIGGRHLVKSIKQECTKCTILEKNAVKVAMGPIQDINLCVATAFYSSQLDLCGPFKAYSNANKRATINVWITVFCCCTTGVVRLIH